MPRFRSPGRWRKTPAWCWSIWPSARPTCRAISIDPNGPGLAELTRGNASFGDIITKDQYSNVHLVATGNVGSDGAALAASPMLATVVEALARSYDHLVLDAGVLGGPDHRAIAEIAPHAFLLTETATGAATAAGRERPIDAGFDDVTVLVGARAGVAAAGAAAA